MVSWYLRHSRRGREEEEEGDIIKMIGATARPSFAAPAYTPVPALFAPHDVDAAVQHGDAGPVPPLVHRADKVPRVLGQVVPLDLVRVLGRGVPPA